MTTERQPSTSSNTTNAYDVVIIGGGAAGLSAAVALGRSRRSVLVIDAGAPRNAPAEGVHNFLTSEGIAPLELQRQGRGEAEKYGVTFLDGEATSATRAGDEFTVSVNGAAAHQTAATPTTVTTTRLLVTTGLTDELPSVPGIRERWGNDVMHCPYCHGWEARDQALGVLASSPRSVHQALMFRQWSDRITLFVNDQPEPTEDEYEILAARGISVVLGEVSELRVTDDAISGMAMTDGSVHSIEGLVVAPRFVANSRLLAELGVTVIEHEMGVGSYVETGFGGATSVPGVWAAGNVADLMAQVVSSAAAGLMAGSAINADLIARGQAEAVAAYRARN